MPKTTTATIKLVLITSRKNKNGECPIVIRVQWNGRKEKYTGISVLPSQWDSKNECIKPCKSVGYDDTSFALTNCQLTDIKSKVLKKKQLYEQKGISYTAADLLSDDEVLSDAISFEGAMEQMVRDKGLSQNTAQVYRYAYKRMKKYYGTIGLNGIEESNLKGFCKSMKGQGMSDSTINTTLSMIKAVFAYLIEKGVDVRNPFLRFKYWKTYRIASRNRTLSTVEINMLLGDFINRSVVVDALGGEWCYFDSAERDLLNRNSGLFAQCCFLLGYYCQGLAFADLVRIKSENISVVEVGGKEYYRIKGMKRKKTNQPIEEIVIEITDEMMPLFEMFIRTMDGRNGYFLPVLQNDRLEYNYDSEKKVSEAIGSCSAVVNRNLRDICERLGIESEGMSYYVCRHSFASHFIASGGNPVNLAKLMGRSPNGIFRYVESLNSVEGVIKERERMFK